MTTQLAWVLRDLPGIAELEQRLERIEAHPNPQWAPERDGLDEAADELARRLFGVCLADLHDEAFDNQDGAVADLLYERLPDTSADLIAFFAADGWDVTDGSGEILLSLGELVYPIIAVMRGIAGEAPTPEGIAARSRVAPEDWGEALEAEARRFSSRRRSR